MHQSTTKRHLATVRRDRPTNFEWPPQLTVLLVREYNRRALLLLFQSIGSNDWLHRTRLSSSSVVCAICIIKSHRIVSGQRITPILCSDRRSPEPSDSMMKSTLCAGKSGSGVRRRFSGTTVMPTSAALVVVLLAATVRLHSVDAFSTNRQRQLERLLGAEGSDGSEIAEANHISKREGKGTCTCTCETRPVAPSVSTSAGADHQAGASSGIVQHSSAKQPESRIPETAALIRTAASMKDATSRPRQPVAMAQQQNSASRNNEISRPQAKASSPTVHRTSPSNSYGHIVKVPPIADDYEAIANGVIGGGRSEEQYDDSNADEKAAQSNEQANNGLQDNWSVDGSERWPWERLPDRVCLREHCVTDRNCCRRWNICDKSAHVCTDCWYGSTCTSERDCCLKYKYCQREWKTDPLTGQSRVVGGKCVDEL